MSFEDGLIHTCTIEEDSPSQDTTGQEVPSYGSPVTGISCRLIIKSERVAVPNAGLVVITTYKLLVPAATVVAAPPAPAPPAASC